jgi:hypothetical protein
VRKTTCAKEAEATGKGMASSTTMLLLDGLRTPAA